MTDPEPFRYDIQEADLAVQFIERFVQPLTDDQRHLVAGYFGSHPRPAIESITFIRT